MEVAGKKEAAAAAAPPPSLLSLCLGAVAAHLTADDAGAGRSGRCSDHFDGVAVEDGEEDGSLMPEHVAEALPWELFYRLASRLPSFALESLHHAAHARCCSSAAATTTVGIGGPDGKKRGVKRSRCEDFNSAWQALFKLRCPLDDNARHDSLVTVDWQQQYWEKHLQECLDEAALLQRLHCFLLFVGVLVS